MDDQIYWAIADRDIDIQNPVTDRKHRLLDDYCDIGDGQRVLDIGCGKAWLLRSWADRFAIEGTGIDVNPRFLEIARRKAPAKGHLGYFSSSAGVFRPEAHAYDIVICLGAVEALGDLPQAVEWMVAAAKPGGRIVVGHPTLRHHPAVPRHDLFEREASFLIEVIERHGAEVSATITASEADYERYESHHRHATLTWARANPHHPDQPEVLARSRRNWDRYQRVIRPYLGWTIFVARAEG